MGLFAFFGTKNKLVQKQVEEDITALESGIFPKVYPLLKPSDWIGIHNGFINQVIIGTREEPKLVAGFCYDSKNNFVFLSPKDFEGKDKETALQTLKDAYKNLDLIDSDFEYLKSFNNKILKASGQDFSSEKILCKSHMIKAHQLLNSNELFVSIPRRRCMLVTSKYVEPEIRSAFIKLHEEAWLEEASENAPIFNGIIVVKNGEIVDSIS